MGVSNRTSEQCFETSALRGSRHRVETSVSRQPSLVHAKSSLFKLSLFMPCQVCFSPVKSSLCLYLDYFWIKAALGLITTRLQWTARYRILDWTMNPALSRLLCLRQGDRAIEDYVEDFCGLCHLVAFNDVALKDIFRFGLNEPLRSQLPGGKIIWSLERYIDFALLWWSSVPLWGFLLLSALLTWWSSAPPWLPALPAPPCLPAPTAPPCLPALSAPPWLHAPLELTWWSPAPLFHSLPLIHGPWVLQCFTVCHCFTAQVLQCFTVQAHLCSIF